MLSSRDVAFTLIGASVTAALGYFVFVKDRFSSKETLRSTITLPSSVLYKKTNRTYLIPAKKLESFAAAIFVKCGLLKVEAEKAAEVLILADLRGIDSHGVARLMAYYSMLKNKIINPRPKIKIIRETESTATVDGDNGLGLVVGPKCNEIAMEKASKVGSGWVSVRNTNHFGIAGSYPLEALKKNMIGISMTNSGSVVAPLRGKQRFLGTNPIAIAFPGTDKDRPMVIDFATSVVPWGKIEEYARENKRLHPQWAIDKNGKECLCPDTVLKEGALMNLGGQRGTSGHKGYCLAAMVDILCAVLSGGNWGPTTVGFTTNPVNYGDTTKDKGKGEIASGENKNASVYWTVKSQCNHCFNEGWPWSASKGIYFEGFADDKFSWRLHRRGCAITSEMEQPSVIGSSVADGIRGHMNTWGIGMWSLYDSRGRAIINGCGNSATTPNLYSCTAEPVEANENIKGIGHFFGAMRIDGFRSVQAFQQTMDLWMGTFRNCDPIDPTQPVIIPGDPERIAMKKREKNGIPVKLAVCADLVDIANECNIPLPFDLSEINLSGVKRVVIDHT